MLHSLRMTAFTNIIELLTKIYFKLYLSSFPEKCPKIAPVKKQRFLIISLNNQSQHEPTYFAQPQNRPTGCFNDILLKLQSPP